MSSETLEIVVKMIKMGRNIDYICPYLEIKKSHLRKVMIENDIVPCETDSEYAYFIDAILIKNHLNDAYFTTDLARIVRLSLSRVRTICNMFNLKPCKKAYCIICGEEIDLSKSKVVSRFCSRRCSDRHRRPPKNSPIVKKCKVCGIEFEGSANSRYCTNDCKEFAQEVRSGIKCLRG